MNRRMNNLFNFIGGNTILAHQCFKELFTKPFYFQILVNQIYNIGVLSIPLIFIMAASVGMVMAFQFGVGLEKFGGKLYIPKLVSVSIIRELGPAFTALMFAARVGAGITSEMSSMAVSQQIDAIRALATSPIKKIVIPRVLACIITLPLLTVFANSIGLFGGLAVGTFDLHLDAAFYAYKMQTSVGLVDYFSGLGKSFAFAIFVALPSCYYGLNPQKGTRGVGNATTMAVVTSSILILIGDFFLTKFFWIFESWK